MSPPAPMPPPASMSEGHSVTSLTVLVLLLLPCMLLLLLLNCFFLACKLLSLSKKRGRSPGAPEEVQLHRFRVSDVSFSPLHTRRRPRVSVSEPVLPHPVTSSRASSREDHRMRPLTPGAATGFMPHFSTSSSCAARVTPPGHPASTLRADSFGKAGWCRSAPRLLQSSGSEAEARVNLVPPNSPMQDTEHIGLIHRSFPYNVLADVSPDFAAVHEFHKADMEYVDLPSQTSCLSTSAAGPGLDSDFGASAGVSLRILSADSDGLSSGVRTSALEWDYYDPCYVRQNNVPKHQHPRPALHTRHYWV